MENITEYKHIEAQLLQLKKAVETMPLGVTISDLEGKILYTNPADAAMHGYGVEELLGKNAGLFAPPELRKPRSLEKVKQWKGLIRESLNLRKDGSVFPVWLMSEVVKGVDGQPCAIVTSCEDISDRKQAERKHLDLEAQLRQAQRLKALGVLAGGIGHEFNNILGTILGYTEILLTKHPEDSTEKSYLEQIHLAGKRATDLVQQILMFSRPQEQALQPTNIIPIITDALNMIRVAIPANIEIRHHLQPNCRPVLADATQIHQLVVNLAINAGYAMKKCGGILGVILEEVTYRTSPKHILGLHSGSYLTLMVSDTGCGMTSEVQEHIFDPFFTTKEIGEGIGLGLSVVHGIVKSHHGVITVDSQPGQGTVFQVFFPVTEKAVSQEAHLLDKSVSGKGTGHILIAEDEAALAIVYEVALTKLGYHITRCNSGSEALEMFRTDPHQFDLVLTDQAMSVMTGSQLSQALLKIKPDIPIILTTGYNDTISEAEAKRLGIRQFLKKPVKLGVLAHAVRKICATKERSQKEKI